MKYKALDGSTGECEIWGPGPKDRTVWAIRRSDGKAIVLKTSGSTRTEIEYETPPVIAAPPKHAVDLAREVVDRYKEAMDLFRPILGPTTPMDPDYTVAVVILEMADRAEKSRTPFINARGGKAPISDKRLREMMDE